MVGQKGGACCQFGVRECHYLGHQQSALLSLSRVIGEGMRVFGIGSRMNVGD